MVPLLMREKSELLSLLARLPHVAMSEFLISWLREKSSHLTMETTTSVLLFMLQLLPANMRQ